MRLGWMCGKLRCRIQLSRSPRNLIKQHPKFISALGIYHLHIGDLAAEMRFEICVLRMILRLRPMLYTIVQRGFQSVKLHAWNVWPLIHHDASDFLLNALWHHAGFAGVDFEAFFQRDATYQNMETLCRTYEIFWAGKDEIIEGASG
jgi:hypothetical protein